MDNDGHKYRKRHTRYRAKRTENQDAGPEAGVPTEAGWKMDCARGVIGSLAANMVVLNYTYLHAFTRFYTLLHAFTQSSWAVTLMWEMEYGSYGVVGRCGKWSVGGALGGIGRMGRMWEKAGARRPIDPPFPAKTRLGRRKWLISRL